MKITIKEKEIELKQSFRSLIIYEGIKGEAFAPKTISDIIIYFYSVVLGSEVGIQLTFDEFLEVLDANPDLLNGFSEWMLNNEKMAESFQQNEEKKTTRKAKKS